MLRKLGLLSRRHHTSRTRAQKTRSPLQKTPQHLDTDPKKTRSTFQKTPPRTRTEETRSPFRKTPHPSDADSENSVSFPDTTPLGHGLRKLGLLSRLHHTTWTRTQKTRSPLQKTPHPSDTDQENSVTIPESTTPPGHGLRKLGLLSRRHHTSRTRTQKTRSPFQKTPHPSDTDSENSVSFP